ncbi:hypothetical protein Tco_0040787 [Tanacetum coccineum]
MVPEQYHAMLHPSGGDTWHSNDWCHKCRWYEFEVGMCQTEVRVHGIRANDWQLRLFEEISWKLYYTRSSQEKDKINPRSDTLTGWRPEMMKMPPPHLGYIIGRIVIDPTKTQKEAMYKVIMDPLTLSPCYNAFLITADICPRFPNAEFVEPHSHEDIVTFIKSLGYKGPMESILDLFTDHMTQP